MDEKRAIQLCLKHRDPAGFDYLVRQYRREAFHHAYALLGNAEDAADACQDSFLKAFAALPQLRELTGFYPWFYRILRNSCLNMLGRRHTASDYRKSRMEVSDPDDKAQDVDPSKLMQQKEEAGEVWEVMRQLKPDFREILAMKYFQGLSYHEISALLNIPRGTVMSRLYLARKSFRERMLLFSRAPENHSTNKETNS
jgi:RNA polymerase sigma-70 factor (ECF subfamily)